MSPPQQSTEGLFSLVSYVGEDLTADGTHEHVTTEQTRTDKDLLQTISNYKKSVSKHKKFVSKYKKFVPKYKKSISKYKKCCHNSLKTAKGSGNDNEHDKGEM